LQRARSIPFSENSRREEPLDEPKHRHWGIGLLAWLFALLAWPIARAMANCERRVKEPCKLYAVDDKVVWRID
jgi:hypothetical protein